MLGQILKERRKARNLSARALAEKAGISQTEVFRIESGSRKRPSMPVLLALGAALGYSGEEIMRLAGYGDNGETPLLEKVFPDLKTEKQRETVKRIVDSLTGRPNLKDSDYDDLVKQVDMYLDYAQRHRDCENM